MKTNDTTWPERTIQEEHNLIEELKKTGKTHCYFCNKPIDPDRDDCSTEFDALYACSECYPKWGNPDRDALLDEDGTGEWMKRYGKNKSPKDD